MMARPVLIEVKASHNQTNASQQPDEGKACLNQTNVSQQLDEGKACHS